MPDWPLVGVSGVDSRSRRSLLRHDSTIHPLTSFTISYERSRAA